MYCTVELTFEEQDRQYATFSQTFGSIFKFPAIETYRFAEGDRPKLAVDDDVANTDLEPSFFIDGSSFSLFQLLVARTIS